MLPIKVLLKQKACNVVLQSSKRKEITSPQVFTFVFIQFFIGATLPKKCVVKKNEGSGKRCKGKRVRHIVELFIEGGLKCFAHYAVLCSKSYWLVAC